MSRNKNIVVTYRGSYGLRLSFQDRIMNRLWYYVAEKNRLWAKFIYYPLHWLEQRKFDAICLIGKHFDDGLFDGEKCGRCYKKLTPQYRNA